jgi:hypothetical protein
MRESLEQQPNRELEEFRVRLVKVREAYRVSSRTPPKRGRALCEDLFLGHCTDAAQGTSRR